MRDEYLQTPVSLRKLAEKYGLPRSALEKRAAQEGWHARKTAAQSPRRSQATETEARAAAPPEAGIAPLFEGDRLAQLQAIGDRLTAQLARATTDLDKQVVQHKRRTREMTYGDPDAPGKPVEETVEEHVRLEVVSVPVSSAGLHRLSTTLKILKEVTLAGGNDEQSLKMVAELMNRLDAEAGREAE